MVDLKFQAEITEIIDNVIYKINSRLINAYAIAQS